MLGVSVACAAVALLPAMGGAAPATRAFADGAATPGLAAARYGHPAGTAEAAVLADSNLSGAVVTGSAFNSVTSTWTEPSVPCGSGGTIGIWVGLDGYGSSTVEQTGVSVDCSYGYPVYQAWYEMYPYPPVYYSNPISAGDHLIATVSHSGSTYTLKMSDTAKGWTKTTTKSMSASNASAEVLLEGQPGAYPNFGTVYFTNSEINGSLLANWNPTLGDASYNGIQETRTSPVSGGSFSITWLHA
ncbi:MAG TPA: G1 family glutamic endopeptidase [Jatrophihabitans sp.]|nr:G1 family glutamic endopeptidase [Jatrophihabitans sp.]